jgi:1-acyl-sn-glycerol-3-phosphate acyltransferase
MELSLQTNSFFQILAKTILRLISWKLDVTLPPARKFVMVGAPHTSNLDLFYALLMTHASGINLHWIGKDSLFHWPLGGLMRWLGGIPVNRRSSNNFVQQIVDIYNQSDELVLAIAPEGTRGKADYWKTGFYYIAQGARVPIALGFIDYQERVVGIGPSLYPTGDIQADFVKLNGFYSGITGRHPEKQGEIRIQ